MAYRILLVGAGGREHALTWKLLGSPLCERLLVAPGNPGIAAHGRRFGERFACRPVAGGRRARLAGPGRVRRRSTSSCVDRRYRWPPGWATPSPRRGVRFFGPTRAAAEIESSKSYAKQLMVAAGVPTAAHGSFTDLAAAEAFIAAQRGQVVVKADGLCAGKGVVVTASAEEARQAVRAMLGDGRFGEAGARVVIEERLFGPEVSMMAFCDGQRVALLASAEDHKAVYDGDQGPNTGGMGAYSPSPLVDEALSARIVDTIFLPTVRALAGAGRPFRGLLYGGLMLTAEGPKVIEWNCRFGDPETQAVLLRMQDDPIPWLLGAATGAAARRGRPASRRRPRSAWCWRPRGIRTRSEPAIRSRGWPPTGASVRTATATATATATTASPSSTPGPAPGQKARLSSPPGAACWAWAAAEPAWQRPASGSTGPSRESAGRAFFTARTSGCAATARVTRRRDHEQPT